MKEEFKPREKPVYLDAWSRARGRVAIWTGNTPEQKRTKRERELEKQEAKGIWGGYTRKALEHILSDRQNSERFDPFGRYRDQYADYQVMDIDQGYHFLIGRVPINVSDPLYEAVSHVVDPDGGTAPRAFVGEAATQADHLMTHWQEVEDVIAKHELINRVIAGIAIAYTRSKITDPVIRDRPQRHIDLQSLAKITAGLC